MKILLQGRSTRSLAATPGGDQVLIDELVKRLRTVHGVDAVACSELTPDLKDVDAVHLFGLVRPQDAWVQARNAAAFGRPIFLSPVYCDVWEFERRARGGLVGMLARHSSRDVIEALKAIGRGVNAHEWGPGSSALLTRGFDRMQREILAMSTLFMPNSQSEWQRVVRDFGVCAPKGRVVRVPIGIEPSTYAPDTPFAPPPHLERYRGCVLCVARIEGRKNQLALIEALRGTPFDLVLAGKDAANQPAYIAKVRRAARSTGQVHLLGAVSEADKRWLYRLARVHILPSWMETAGISSLEAAMAGCSLVVTPNGDTEEYFGADVQYCDPAKVGSIRAAVFRAAELPPSKRLVSRLVHSYTWERAADLTYEAYRVGLGRAAGEPAARDAPLPRDSAEALGPERGA